MKKLFSLCLVFVLLFSAASAEKFTLRKDIAWGDSLLTFLKKIQSEGLKPFSAKELDPDSFPDEMWVYYIPDISFGREDEEVIMLAAGSKQDGLFLMVYLVSSSDKYSRAADLTASLGKKYGKFYTQGKNDSYQAWQYLSDGTGILVFIPDDNIWIQYTSPDWEEIKTQIEDGSFSILTPFGL